MNKDRTIRRTQHGWHPASDHSPPLIRNSSLNCPMDVTIQPPLVTRTYESNTAVVQPEGYGIKDRLSTDTVHYLSAQNQTQPDGAYRFMFPLELENRQCIQTWNFSIPGEHCIGTISGYESFFSITGNAPPVIRESEDDTCVEEEDDHAVPGLTREPTPDTQTFADKEKDTCYLACPFYKHDPRRFSKPKWKSCAHPGYENMHRVKEHLKRCHTTTAKRSAPEEIIREIQFEQMKSWGRTAGRGKPAIDQWQHTYRTLFPFDDMIPSPYQDEIPGLFSVTDSQQPQRVGEDEKILDLLPSRLQLVIEEDQDLRYLPVSSQHRIVQKFKRCIKQLLNHDKVDTDEGSQNPDTPKASSSVPALPLPSHKEEEPQPPDLEQSFLQPQKHQLEVPTTDRSPETQRWNWIDRFINANNQPTWSVAEDMSSLFANEIISEIPHIPQHQLSWYGTAVDTADNAPEIDAFLYKPRRPRRLKMEQEDFFF